MKLITVLLLMFLAFTAKSQTPNNFVFRNIYERTHGVYPDSVLHIPTGCGFPSLLTTRSWQGGAALYADTCNNKLYFYRDTAWVYQPDSAFVMANGGVDTTGQFVNLIERTPGKDSIIFWIGGTRYVIKDSTGGGSGVTSVATNNGSGITGGTITTTGTLVIDTVNISTKYNAKRVADSSASVKQNLLKLGNDHTFTGDSLFLKGVWVNVKDYGATGNGVTDDLAAINAAKATGKNVFFPAGRYFVSALVELTTKGQMFFGVGDKSTISGTHNGRFFWIHENDIKIQNLRFAGDGKATGNVFQTGILIYEAIRFDISYCNFDSLGGEAALNGGGGIFCANIAAANSAGGRISNCGFYNNNAGLTFSSRGEYVTVVNITAENNTVGMCVGAGNITTTGGIIENNRTGILLLNGTNGGHGVMTGVFANHNDTAMSVRDIPYTNIGYQFTNCNFYFGKLSFINSANIRFSNCNFVALDSVSINGSVGLVRSSCYWGTDVLGNIQIPHVFNGGQDFTTIGEIRNTTSTPNYFIKQQYADTILFAGPIYLMDVPYNSSAGIVHLGIDTVAASPTFGKLVRKTAGTVTNVTATSPMRITSTSTTTPNVVADTSRNADFLVNHGRAKQMIDSLGALFASSTYTPSLTSVTNVTATSVSSGNIYYRIGTNVTVSGEFEIDPTGAGAVEVGISLPIASNLAGGNDLNGVATSELTTEPAVILADGANNRGAIKFTAVSTANRLYKFTFTYKVL